MTLATAGLGDAVLAETGSLYWAAGASGWANGVAQNALQQLRGNGGSLQCIDIGQTAQAGAIGAVSSVAFAGVLNGVSSALSVDSPAPFVPNDAHSAMQAEDLARQLASEEQYAQALAGDGEPIFGAGTGRNLLDADRLSEEYGGDPGDWAKMRSENSAVHNVQTRAGDNFETHWYQNVRTNQVVEIKTKIAGH